MFTPIENLVFHHYEREKAASVYSDHNDTWWDEEQRSITKAREDRVNDAAAMIHSNSAHFLKVSTAVPHEAVV